MQTEDLDQFKSELIDAFKQALHAERAIDDLTHRDHHDFVKLMILERQRRVDRAEKIKAQVGGWMIIAILGSIGTAVYQFFFTGKHP